jgi:DNA-3-methyladenine glycosylase
MDQIIDLTFFERDVLDVAPGLLGNYLVIADEFGRIKKYLITETEAYRGEQDQACHASKGRTKRTEIMYHSGGCIYVYLIYGVHWMLNFVTGPTDDPQAVLIRSLFGIEGPGRVTKALNINKNHYGLSLIPAQNIWCETGLTGITYKSSTRIGIDYAGRVWREKPWRYIIDIKTKNFEKINDL